MRELARRLTGSARHDFLPQIADHLPVKRRRRP
jgi:hypothetical protein